MTSKKQSALAVQKAREEGYEEGQKDCADGHDAMLELAEEQVQREVAEKIIEILKNNRFGYQLPNGNVVERIAVKAILEIKSRFLSGKISQVSEVSEANEITKCKQCGKAIYKNFRFCSGDWVRKNPDKVRKILEEKE